MSCKSRILRSTRLAPIALALVCLPLFGQTASEIPGIVQHSIDHGSVSPTKESTVIVQLRPQNEEAFNQAIQELYTAGSATYHQWMTDADFAKYAPSKATIELVRQELVAGGLSILSVDPHGFSIRARGTTLSLERAFQTQLHYFEYNGKMAQANIAPAVLRGEAGKFVEAVSGLAEIPAEPLVKRVVDPVTGKALGKSISLKEASSINLNDYFTNSCFGPAATKTLTTAGATLPVGIYYGTTYSPGTKLCSWTPAQLQVNYGMQNAYNRGLDGAGQTIAVVEGPVDAAQIVSDAQAFSSVTGLPPVNVSVVYPDGQPTAAAIAAGGWTIEADLDVQWSHAFAPGAKIIMLVTPDPTGTLQELLYAIQYATAHKLANVISNSYGWPEFYLGAYEISGFEQVLKTAAAAGVAVNFSSGDSGDGGTGSPDAGGDIYPGASTYATSVGGTSIGLPGPTGYITAGWGNNIEVLSLAVNDVLNPPVPYGELATPPIPSPFYGGSGGGESSFISKPFWQSALSGKGRQQPDISALADPYTGVIFVTTESSGQVLSGGLGGTSLACPLFSAMWAIADQEAGKSLGQAAPLIYSSLGKNSTATYDVVPFNGPTNVSGTIYDSSGQTFYSATALLEPLYSTTQFLSSLSDFSGNGTGAYVDISFGTDTSLTVTKGWDNVTGWGIPKGPHFIDAAAKLK